MGANYYNNDSDSRWCLSPRNEIWQGIVCPKKTFQCPIKKSSKVVSCFVFKYEVLLWKSGTFFLGQECFWDTRYFSARNSHFIVLVRFQSDVLFIIFTPNVAQLEAPTSRNMRRFHFWFLQSMNLTINESIKQSMIFLTNYCWVMMVKEAEKNIFWDTRDLVLKHLLSKK